MSKSCPRKKHNYTSIGGQALIEGIMMRGPKQSAISCRHTKGGIVTEYLPCPSPADRPKILKLPFIRGVVGFIDSLRVGYKALMRSVELSGMAELEDAEVSSKLDKWLEKHFGEKMLAAISAVAMVLGVALAVVLFFLLPALLFNGVKLIFGDGIEPLRALFEGIVKIVIFLLYVILISQMKDIRRVFEYHGAEHKTIFCFEAEEELTVENVRRHRRFHPRCGTSFLLIMMVVGILISFLISYLTPAAKTLWIWVPVKILIVPVIMAIGYELLKLCGKHDNLATRIIAAPGLWMQRLTTREPDDGQIECAIAALKAVLPGGEAVITAKPDEAPAETEDAENEGRGE